MSPRLGRSLAAVALASVAGCSGASSGGSAHSTPDPDFARLLSAARLAPCPASSPAAVSGGLPDLTLHCLGDGPAVHLAGLKGPAVVNVWGSWCGPCQKEAGFLSAVARDLRHEVSFLGVDTEDSSDSALDFGIHVNPPVRYPSVVDPDRKVLIALAKAPGPPETAFVGRDGKVVHVHTGGYASAAALRADIATYLHVR